MGVRSILEESLEGSFGPIVWISGLCSIGAPSITIEVGAIVIDAVITMVASVGDSHHGSSSCEFGEHIIEVFILKKIREYFYYLIPKLG